MSLIACDFRCPSCGDFEQIVERPSPDVIPCPTCDLAAVWIISAPHPKILSVPCYATTRGGDMQDRPPGMLDTRPLADGQRREDWQKANADKRSDRRHKQLIANGMKSKRVQVG